MQYEVKFAGFGGQGIMMAGKLLAYAAMQQGYHVVWLPSYGPEMRGGTAYCTVVLADRPIGSPVVNNPGNLIVMNRPSMEKFESTVRPGGIIIINSSLVPIEAKRQDVDAVRVPCNDIAISLGNGRAANMVALGAFVARSRCVPFEQLVDITKDQFGRKADVLALNVNALERGKEAAAG